MTLPYTAISIIINGIIAVSKHIEAPDKFPKTRYKIKSNKTNTTNRMIAFFIFSLFSLLLYKNAKNNIAIIFIIPPISVCAMCVKRFK